MSVETDDLDAGAQANGTSVHLRSEWSARAPKGSMGGAALKLAVVHHSASGNDYTSEQVPAVIRSIQTYHMDSNGWSDIGYNFIVDKYGGVWEGREGSATRNTSGAHASDFNTGSVGVVALGDFRSAAPSEAQTASISEIIAQRFARNGVKPNTSVQFTSGGGPKYPVGTVVALNRVIGHTDVGATECPGARLYPSVAASIR